MTQEQTQPKEKGGMEVVDACAENGTDELRYRHAGGSLCDSPVIIRQIRPITRFMVER